MLAKEDGTEKKSDRGKRTVREKQKTEPPRMKVRCPLCKWDHDWKPYWACELCDARFDTFVTKAHCPDPTCGNSWELTWCPRCGNPSPHLDWYVKEGPRTS